MHAMSPPEMDSSLRKRARRPRAALVAIVITAALCVAALALRTPIRSRYWAWCLARAASPAERGVYLTGLCNAGAAGRWGIAALLSSRDGEVRQYGVLALQHLKTDWARQQLLECLTDPDPSMGRLAATGLAIHRDESVIPVLKSLYETGDESAATTACIALEYLATPPAIAALSELAGKPADPGRRAALVDTLAGVGQPECVLPLLRLLSDHRPCDTPPRSNKRAQFVLDDLRAAGYSIMPSSRATTAPVPRTIAERAAAALARITGLSPAFSSVAPEEERKAAEGQWAEWYARRPPGP